MQQTSSSLNGSRFIRLLAVSAVDMLLSVPFAIASLAFRVRTVQPTLNWVDTHYDFGAVYSSSLQDAELSRPGSSSMQALSVWLPIFASFFYFACFGMHDTFLESYIQGYHSIARKLSSHKACVFPSFSSPVIVKPTILPSISLNSQHTSRPHRLSHARHHDRVTLRRLVRALRPQVEPRGRSTVRL
jgi:hypothetical protein